MCFVCNFLIEKLGLACKIFYKVMFCSTFSESESDNRCALLHQNT